MGLGYRKLVITLLALAIGAFVPLTETQADVVITVTLGFIGGNIGEHIGGVLREAMAARADRTAGSGSGPVREQKG
jgi:hypothetical protein